MVTMTSLGDFGACRVWQKHRLKMARCCGGAGHSNEQMPDHCACSSTATAAVAAITAAIAAAIAASLIASASAVRFGGF